MFDNSVFQNIKSKKDFDRQREALFAQAKQRGMQNKLGDLQIRQAENALNTPETLTAEQLIAKSIQLGGIAGLSPQEQAQLQAYDIAQRTKQSVDARGNVVSNRSVYDLLGMPAGQATQMPPSAFMGGQRADSGAISPTMQTVQNAGNFQDVASQPDLPMDGLPQDLFDPTMQVPSIPRPDTSGLSPYTAEDLLSKWKEENMKLQGEAAVATSQRIKDIPKAELAFNQLRDDTENMINTVDRAIDQTSNLSAGYGSILSSIPATGAKNLESTLSTISADAAFSTLQQMRDASKTGGALGAISEKELGLLQNAKTALDQSQSPSQLKTNLENYKRIRSNALKNTAEGFKLDYGYYPKGLQEFINGEAQPKQEGGVSWEEYFK